MGFCDETRPPAQNEQRKDGTQLELRPWHLTYVSGVIDSHPKMGVGGLAAAMEPPPGLHTSPSLPPSPETRAAPGDLQTCRPH
jgi:hypothetical protein